MVIDVMVGLFGMSMVVLDFNVLFDVLLILRLGILVIRF